MVVKQEGGADAASPEKEKEEQPAGKSGSKAGKGAKDGDAKQSGQGKGAKDGVPLKLHSLFVVLQRSSLEF